jgi:hypothetical protein
VAWSRLAHPPAFRGPLAARAEKHDADKTNHEYSSPENLHLGNSQFD